MAAPAPRAEGLAALRERNGISINDIAERTRIPLHHLEELERGDISQWPVGVYAKSWAREYAVEAGLDPDQVVALVAPVAAVEPSIEEIKHAREEGERLAAGMRDPMTELMKKAAAVVIVLALLALAVLYLWPARQAGVETAQPVGTSGQGESRPATPAQPQR